jgi:gas vesicle protein
MGKFMFGLAVVGAAAIGAAAALAYRISQETGKSFTESINEVPAEAERYMEEMFARGREAYDAGRAAAAEKQAEIEKRLGERL